MSIYFGLPLLALAAALQASIMPQIRIAQGQPDLVFLLVLAWSIRGELEDGVWWAFIGGIFKDLLSLSFVGTSTFGMLLVIFGVNVLSRQVYGLGFVLISGIVLTATVIQQLVTMIILVLTIPSIQPGYSIDFIDGFRYVIIPTMFYNFIFFWPIYWFIRGIQRRYENRIR